MTPLSDAIAQTPPAEDNFTHIAGTIFQKVDTNGNGTIGDSGDLFVVSLDILATAIANSTDTDPPVAPNQDFFPVSSPCLNRISNELQFWIDDLTIDPSILLPGDSGGQSPQGTTRTSRTLEVLPEVSGRALDCDFDPDPDDFAGGSGGGGIGEGSGGGFTVNPDPDPATTANESDWDPGNFDDFFEENASDCKETFRWLLNRSIAHYPDGIGTDSLDVDFDDDLKTLRDDLRMPRSERGLR